MATADMSLLTERDALDNGFTAHTIYNRLVFDGVIDEDANPREKVVPAMIDLMNEARAICKMRDAAEGT